MAANNKILTSRSSNCSKTNCHMDFPVKEEEKWDYANVQQLNEIDHMVHKKSPE